MNEPGTREMGILVPAVIIRSRLVPPSHRVCFFLGKTKRLCGASLSCLPLLYHSIAMQKRIATEPRWTEITPVLSILEIVFSVWLMAEGRQVGTAKQVTELIQASFLTQHNSHKKTNSAWHCAPTPGPGPAGRNSGWASEEAARRAPGTRSCLWAWRQEGAPSGGWALVPNR